MSIAVYCRDAPIKPPYFYIWRRRLREQQPCAGGFLELIPRRLTEAAASGIRIRLGAKLAIEVARGFDSFTHLSVVEALSGNYSKRHNGLTAAIRIHLYHLYLRYVKILRRPVRHHPFRFECGSPVRFFVCLREPPPQHGQTSLLGPRRPGSLV